MTDMTATVMLGDQAVTLADLAGIDMSKIAEVRFENFPAGMFRWRLKSAAFKKIGEGETAVAAAEFVHECIGVHALLDKDEIAEKWMGKTQQEAIFLHEPEALGRVRARMTDIGHHAQPGLSYQQNFDAAVGLQYDAQVVKTPNKKNPEAEPFTNMRKFKPFVAVPGDAPVAVAA